MNIRAAFVPSEQVVDDVILFLLLSEGVKPNKITKTMVTHELRKIYLTYGYQADVQDADENDIGYDLEENPMILLQLDQVKRKLKLF